MNINLVDPKVYEKEILFPEIILKGAARILAITMAEREFKHPFKFECSCDGCILKVNFFYFFPEVQMRCDWSLLATDEARAKIHTIMEEVDRELDKQEGR